MASDFGKKALAALNQTKNGAAKVKTKTKTTVATSKANISTKKTTSRSTPMKWENPLTQLKNKMNAKSDNSRNTASAKKETAKGTTTTKTSVVRNTKGKMSPNSQVGPSHLGRANPQTSSAPKATAQKSTAPKTSVVRQSERDLQLGPQMDRGTPRRGNAVNPNEGNKAKITPTYSTGSSLATSNVSKASGTARKTAGEDTVETKRKLGRSMQARAAKSMGG